MIYRSDQNLGSFITALNPTGTCSRGRAGVENTMSTCFFRQASVPWRPRKIHVDMIRISMELPGGNLVFDRRKYKFEATKIVHVKPVAVVFFFQFLGVWRFCLYLWVPYNLGHAFLTLFTVAALLFWYFLSRLVLEANERRKVLARGFLGGFFTFQGRAYIYGFLVTWRNAFPTLFTVAALFVWCFLSRLILEANKRREVLARGFLGGFFTFQQCACIYEFLITWGKP